MSRTRTLRLELGERSYPIVLGEGILEDVGPVAARVTTNAVRRAGRLAA